MSNQQSAKGSAPNTSTSPIDGPELAFGDVVVDSEEPPHEQSRGVVVQCPDKAIEDWVVCEERTVAEDNPGYNPREQVAIVVYHQDLVEEFPYYTNARPLLFSQILDRGLAHYAFPESRLEKIGERRSFEIPLSKIAPSPYHSRSYSVENNRRFIKKARRLGHPKPLPQMRVQHNTGQTEFHVLDGHKRIWVAHVASCESIPVRCLYMNDENAAKMYLHGHAEKLSEDQMKYVCQQIEQRLDTPVEQFLDKHGWVDCLPAEY
jgi:ParB family chromosome partitioning protein